MKRRVLCFLLAALLLCCSVSAAPNQSPYAIKVNRALNTVTVYGLDENGEYTLPVKAMICSTARQGYATPLGEYKLIAYRSEWRPMLDGTYGQYATSFNGHYLFHSICYSEPSKDALIREEYNDLGSPASMGCVRLQTIDAKWIYDNCPAGTKVTVYDDPNDPGPLGKPEKKVEFITQQAYNGWDPTDPDANNPWNFVPAESVKIFPTVKSINAGESAQLIAGVEPAAASKCGLTWSSSDSAVAKIASDGTVLALSSGSAEISVSTWDGLVDTYTIRVEGELLPFSDLTPGAWYYRELRSALESGLLQGMGGGRFAPAESMTRAMVVQMLYNLADKPRTTYSPVFSDVSEDAWYGDAVMWAKANGVVNGYTETEFAPDRPMTRQELAAVLWRYAGQPSADGTPEIFSDWEQVDVFAEQALLWMTQEKLMQGADGKLNPCNTATRVETAVVLQRFSEK